jgi:excisionase family DNA binding protein
MLLKIKQAAAELGIAAKTLRKWIKTGQLKAVRLGRQWRVDADELALFIRRRTI